MSPVAPSTKPSVKVVYSMPYKAGTKQWSQRFHFNGAIPASDAEWSALMVEIAPDAEYIISTNGSLVEMIGYLAGSDVPVYTHAFGVAGLFDGSGDNVACPGDVAALTRFTTDARTSKNHPIYLFKYSHQAYHQPGERDNCSNDMITRLNGYYLKWINGSYSVAGTPIDYCGPYGAVGLTRNTETYLTHRDFPNRS